MELTHFNEQGRARMVDVSEKVQTYRVARAAATVRMAKATMDKIKEGSIGKGDVLARCCSRRWTSHLKSKKPPCTSAARSAATAKRALKWKR